MFAHVFLTLLWIASASAILVRRQSTCYEDIYCSPVASDVWLTNGTTYLAYWNTQNPAFTAAAGQILIKLVDVSQPTGYLELKQSANSIGYAPFTLSDLDFGGPNSSNNYKAKQVFLSIYPDGSSNTTIGPIFTIIQPGANGALPDLSKPIPIPATVTVDNPATGVPAYAGGKRLSTTATVLIAVGAAVAAALAAIFVMMLRKRNNVPQVAEGFALKKTKSLDSTAPLAAPRPISDPDNSSLNSHSISPSATAISTNEAIMIAQTYRQLMRKPSWSKDSANASRAQEIIAQELREEGHDLHDVRRGSAVQVGNLEPGESVAHQ